MQSAICRGQLLYYFEGRRERFLPESGEERGDIWPIETGLDQKNYAVLQHGEQGRKVTATQFTPHLMHGDGWATSEHPHLVATKHRNGKKIPFSIRSPQLRNRMICGGTSWSWEFPTALSLLTQDWVRSIDDRTQVVDRLRHKYENH